MAFAAAGAGCSASPGGSSSGGFLSLGVQSRAAEQAMYTPDGRYRIDGSEIGCAQQTASPCHPSGGRRRPLLPYWRPFSRR